MVEEYIEKNILVSEYNEAKSKLQGAKLLTHNWGLYFFYDINDRLLYIGWARGFSNRIGNHLRGNSNTKKFTTDIHRVKLMNQDKFDSFRNKYKDCLDIEYYLISKMKPLYNKELGLKTAFVK